MNLPLYKVTWYYLWFQFFYGIQFLGVTCSWFIGATAKQYFDLCPVSPQRKYVGGFSHPDCLCGPPQFQHYMRVFYSFPKIVPGKITRIWPIHIYSKMSRLHAAKTFLWVLIIISCVCALDSGVSSFCSPGEVLSFNSTTAAPKDMSQKLPHTKSIDSNLFARAKSSSSSFVALAYSNTLLSIKGSMPLLKILIVMSSVPEFYLISPCISSRMREYIKSF